MNLNWLWNAFVPVLLKNFWKLYHGQIATLFHFWKREENLWTTGIMNFWCLNSIVGCDREHFLIFLDFFIFLTLTLWVSCDNQSLYKLASSCANYTLHLYDMRWKKSESDAYEEFPHPQLLFIDYNLHHSSIHNVKLQKRMKGGRKRSEIEGALPRHSSNMITDDEFI